VATCFGFGVGCLHGVSFLIVSLSSQTPSIPHKKTMGHRGASSSAFVYPCDCSILRIASNKVDLFRVAHTIVASSVKSPAQATLLTTFWVLLLASLKSILPAGTLRVFIFRLSRSSGFQPRNQTTRNR
jgi:hypothetical protein